MTPLENFKAQLDGWMRYHDLYTNNKGIEGVWGPPRPGDAEWIGAIVYIEDSCLYGIFNAWRGDWVELLSEVEALMEKCGVWYEQEDCCNLWIYDPDVLDAHCEQKEASNGA